MKLSPLPPDGVWGVGVRRAGHIQYDVKHEIDDGKSDNVVNRVFRCLIFGPLKSHFLVCDKSIILIFVLGFWGLCIVGAYSW